jgi:SAM-dependent methyltransferase
MDKTLNEVETDFVEFMAAKRNRPLHEIEDIFRRTKDRFRFTGLEYAKLTGDIPCLYRIMYDTKTEADLIECYRVHQLLHLFKYISYTYPKPKSSLFRELRRDLGKGEWRNITNFVRRKLAGKTKKEGLHLGPQGIAGFLVDAAGKTPVAVDYGSGAAYVSYEIAKAYPDARIFLVDIDCLVMEFARFRLSKLGADVHTIPVTGDNPYPPLPQHNICIASEVMEHLAHPLTAYENIHNALQPGGILYGDFSNHEPNMFHVSPDLAMLRERIAADFTQIDNRCYRKHR